ncbi:hypothetical protein CAEBREN_29267 [Caenorhabditis brenneri]|uniref:Uncharacterized protein n=1 Tax=Caenorhabditis brenneri TaxID=135651 RepID=G0P6Y3_CAEBE|nr:hypothetical protein CAEBREN_29267 [Caenorhabditis brenneri]
MLGTTVLLVEEIRKKREDLSGDIFTIEVDRFVAEWTKRSGNLGTHQKNEMSLLRSYSFHFSLPSLPFSDKLNFQRELWQNVGAVSHKEIEQSLVIVYKMLCMGFFPFTILGTVILWNTQIALFFKTLSYKAHPEVPYCHKKSSIKFIRRDRSVTYRSSDR